MIKSVRVAFAVLVAAAGVSVAVQGTLAQGAGEGARLVIGAWHGAYGKAQEAAIIEPFRQSSGVDVRIVPRLSDAAGLGAAIPPEADVVELGRGQLEAACESGDVVAIGDIKLDDGADGRDALEDFVPAAISRCGIGSFIWSTLFVTDPHSFNRKAPQTLKDVFDIRGFPGMRAMVKNPRGLFEMALMADGVKGEKVYQVLATEAGTRRALKRLGWVRRQITWVERPSQALEALGRNEATFAMTYSGRAFTPAISRGFKLIWDGSVHDVTFWAVPRSARNEEGARTFIRFATAPVRLAEQSRLWPYGPARLTSVGMVGRHSHLGIELAPYLPSAPENLSRGVVADGAFWRQHGERLERALTEWSTVKVSDARSGRKIKKKAKKKRNGRRNGRKSRRSRSG